MCDKWFIICFYIFVANFATGDCKKVEFQDVSTDFTNNIFIYLVKGINSTENAKLPIEDGLMFPNYDFFDSKRETVFYFHGWGENVNRESVITVAKALLKKNTVNLAIFDYSVLVKANNHIEYLESIVNASTIGTAIGQYLQQYIPRVQSLSHIHLISHSLGSQVMSKVAKTYGAGKLPWLTGLDPAGPLYNIPLIDHLEASDGVFVDVIHTDGGFYGDYRSIGTIDFFPNRGTRIQPNCKRDPIGTCSHHSSWQYYADSIMNPTAFLARRCLRMPLCEVNLKLCPCKVFEGEYTYIGYNVNKSAHGDYYLQTNNKLPFGKGKKGVNF